MRRALGGFAAATILLAACEGSGAPEGGDAQGGRIPGPALPSDENARLVRGGTGSARITYQPNVRVVERQEVLGSLAGVSTDGYTLLFEPAAPALRSLRAGDVLVARGLFARKVLAVEAEGARLAALTAPASLGEVVRDGRIHLEIPARFAASGGRTGGARSVPQALLDLAVPPAHAQGPGAVAKGAVSGVLSGWHTKFSAEPGRGRMGLSLRMAKEVGGFKGLITGTGYIADFDLASDIEIERGLVQRLDMTFRRLNGVMNFTWEVGKDSPGGYAEKDYIKLPGAIAVPLYQLLDGFPLFLEVGGALLVQPVITGGQQYSHGSFRVTYDGAQGFRVKEGNIDNDGTVTGDIQLVTDRHVSALAPVGMVVALAAPRVELTLDPLKMLGELQAGGGAQKSIKEAAEKVDKIAQRLLQRALGPEAARRARDFSATKAAEAMKSNATAFVQVVTMNAVTHSGISVVTPCTHTDMSVQFTVGAGAQALGQARRASKVVFEKKVTRIDPPGTRLCAY
jgi:hypothetical protein